MEYMLVCGVCVCVCSGQCRSLSSDKQVLCHSHYTAITYLMGPTQAFNGRTFFSVNMNTDEL